jgi:uncharacterized membrane protein (UPF0136 family)
MPSLSLNIGLNNGRKLPFGFDSDAAAFFATAGVTDATAKTQINSFVKGIKDLGLYNNMVCWPLRSSQNAGTGTTAYSLGGYGIYNGTLTGSSSWSESGAVIPANSGITATIPYGPTSGSIIGVIQANSINGAGRTYSLLKNSNSGIFCPYQDAVFYFDYPETNSRLSVASGIVQGVMFFVAGYAGASGHKVFRNTTQIASNATVASISANTINILASGNAASQVTPFAMLLNADASANNSAIYNLYKTTLGQGLGLP